MAEPTAPHAMPYRAWVRHMSGLLSPPDFGSTASPGSRTSLNTSSEVSLARRECLPCIDFASYPSIPFSTRNPRIPSSVLAHTTATWAIEPLVIHILEPLRTHPSPSLVARVATPPGFEP